MKSSFFLCLSLVAVFFTVLACETWADVSAGKKMPRNSDEFLKSGNRSHRSYGAETPLESGAGQSEAEPVYYALLIGVNAYDMNTEKCKKLAEDKQSRAYASFDVSLKYCGNDMQKLKDALIAGKLFKEENITLLTDSTTKPTSVNIRKELQSVRNKIKNEDMFLVAFAGHGIALTLNEKTTSFLAPSDAEVFYNSDTKRWGHGDSLIELSELFDELPDSVCKVSILDACRNVAGAVTKGGNVTRSVVLVRGSNAGNTEMDMQIPAFREDDLGKYANMYRLTSCNRGQQAFESSEFQHGIFSYFLIEGLKSSVTTDDEGDISIFKLAKYVGDKTAKWVKENKNAEQNPKCSASDANWELVLAKGTPSEKDVKIVEKEKIVYLDKEVPAAQSSGTGSTGGGSHHSGGKKSGGGAKIK
jgi:uncharacterized caspase-like protein